MWKLIQTLGIGNLSGEQRRLALYSALFLPFRNTVYKDKNEKSIPVVNYIFKVSMKQRSRDAETVINIHCAAERFVSLILPLQLNNRVQHDKLE
ncbi:unnamed protein product [Arabis nemorensis]|uniref:Uncharacterized protein n=1 Tax=Arabis nemorensis TaxID=586526 RepID=A0A565AN38_9BRAS|nr:unnamed protein product [Arabis nemorensis]